jgi:hypothetical protein
MARSGERANASGERANASGERLCQKDKATERSNGKKHRKEATARSNHWEDKHRAKDDVTS